MPPADTSPESCEFVSLLLSPALKDGKLRPQAPEAQGHKVSERLSWAEPSSTCPPCVPSPPPALTASLARVHTYRGCGPLIPGQTASGRVCRRRPRDAQTGLDRPEPRGGCPLASELRHGALDCLQGKQEGRSAWGGWRAPLPSHNRQRGQRSSCTPGGSPRASRGPAWARGCCQRGSGAWLHPPPVSSAHSILAVSGWMCARMTQAVQGQPHLPSKAKGGRPCRENPRSLTLPPSLSPASVTVLGSRAERQHDKTNTQRTRLCGFESHLSHSSLYDLGLVI